MESGGCAAAVVDWGCGSLVVPLGAAASVGFAVAECLVEPAGSSAEGSFEAVPGTAAAAVAGSGILLTAIAVAMDAHDN